MDNSIDLEEFIKFAKLVTVDDYLSHYLSFFNRNNISKGRSFLCKDQDK